MAGDYVAHQSVHFPDGRTRDSWYRGVCGHCGTVVSFAIIGTRERVSWLLCTSCGKGSVYVEGEIYPGIPFGPEIRGLPTDIAEAYQEARRSMSVEAFTGAELICRKILMHVAVDKGAKEGESFASYLDHLRSQGYITPPMKGWVDLIRQHGNIAAHVLEKPDRKRAESTLMFTAELLRIVYEMDYLAKQYKTEDTEEESNEDLGKLASI